MVGFLQYVELAIRFRIMWFHSEIIGHFAFFGISLAYQDMPKICPRYGQDMAKICPRYASASLKVRLKSLSDSLIGMQSLAWLG